MVLINALLDARKNAEDPKRDAIHHKGRLIINQPDRFGTRTDLLSSIILKDNLVELL